MRSVRALAVLWTVGMGQSALAGQVALESPGTAKEWLERMIHAAQTLNYEGTFVYVQGQDIEVMRIVHSSDQSGDRQRMYSLNGPMREVVVTGNRVMCWLPKQQVAFSTADPSRSPLPISLPRELNKLEASYRFEMLDDDRVAGMQTRVIAIRPRDELRYGYRLWLDHNTGMVLGSALVDRDEQIIEQLVFTDFQVRSNINAALFTPQHALTALQPPAETVSHPADADGAPEWTIEHLPQGFNRILRNRYVDAGSANPTEQIVLSDGLATVSVFIDQLADARPLLQGASHMGSANAYGTVVGNFQILVVGEVPVETAEWIAGSIKRSDAKP
ncbi:MAG: MucB/RseB C-terminal domain-containing protein [Gammaproteobacteria bacterium]